MLGNYGKIGIYTRDTRSIASAIVSCIHNDYEMSKLFEDFDAASRDYRGYSPAIALISDWTAAGADSGLPTMQESAAYLLSLSSLIPENANFLLMMPATSENVKLASKLVEEKRAFVLYDASHSLPAHEYMEDVNIVTLRSNAPHWCRVPEDELDSIAVFDSVPRYASKEFIEFSYLDDYYVTTVHFGSLSQNGVATTKDAYRARLKETSDALFDVSLGRVSFPLKEADRVLQRRYEILASHWDKTEQGLFAKRDMSVRRYRNRMFGMIPHDEEQVARLEELDDSIVSFDEFSAIWLYALYSDKDRKRQAHGMHGMLKQVREAAIEDGADPLERLTSLADEHGITPMIDSMMAGVPVEDVIA